MKNKQMIFESMDAIRAALAHPDDYQLQYADVKLDNWRDIETDEANFSLANWRYRVIRKLQPGDVVWSDETREEYVIVYVDDRIAVGVARPEVTEKGYAINGTSFDIEDWEKHYRYICKATDAIVS